MTASDPIKENFGSTSEEGAFSFQEEDLYSDFYSYASLALADYNREALLDADLLANISNKVFSTFLQAFVSLPNGYDGYWAFQSVGEQRPFGLDFEPRVTTTITSTTTYISTLCSMSPEPASQYIKNRHNGTTVTSVIFLTEMVCLPTANVTLTSTITETMVTYPNTNPTPTVTTTSQPMVGPPLLPPLARRETPTPSSKSSNEIPATLSIRTDILVISSLALFFSIGILAFLILSTFVVYHFSSDLKKLPRSVDCPASVFGFVYASERLKEWANQREVERERNAEAGFRARWMRRTREDDDAQLRLGSFTGTDGKVRWGIELHGPP
jgi:hypothetical protein